MNPVFRYSFYEMIRSRWAYFYTGFYLLATITFQVMSFDLAKTLISMTNICLVITPLIGILFGSTYYYNSKEFILLLLSKPLSRWKIILSIYMGLALTLCTSVLVGVGLPLLAFGVIGSESFIIYLLLLGASCLLSVIFSLLAFWIAMRFNDKVKGLSINILVWLFFAVIYDGLILLLLFFFKDYPLDKATIAVVLLNPIDLARILIIMHIDVSAMMGYTGAVLSRFLGEVQGMIIIFLALSVWTLLPLWGLRKLCMNKDF